jgi:hypothetical protein
LGWTGAELSNIWEDQTVPILTSVLTNNYLLLLLYFGYTTDRREGYSTGILPSSAGAVSSKSASVFCGVFITEKVDGAVGKTQ